MRRRTFLGGAAASLCALPSGAGAAVRPKVAAIVDRYRREHAFAGVVATARGGRMVDAIGVGAADIEAGLPNDPMRTRFAFGSASKWLAAVAVLRLVEEGRLALDRPITAYLPGFRGDTGARVTLRHLLSNTSGIPDLLGRAAKADPAVRASRDGSAVMVARYADGDLLFAPGLGWGYHVLNWVIVHAIVERVTGVPFERTLDRLVFRPLAMRSAGLVDNAHPPTGDVAAAYGATLPAVRKMTLTPAFAAASGTVYGTAAEAVRAAHGIFSTGLLMPASRAALTTIMWPTENYALGGRVRDIGGRRWAWEPGKIEGYRALIAHDLAGDRTIAIFNNTDMPQGTIGELGEALIAAA